MSNSPTLACSRWCSSSLASGARLFSPAWPAARNWSRHCEARAAVIPNSRNTDSRSSPRSRRSTVARLRRAENRPFRSRSAARSSRPPGALRRRRFLNLLPHLDTPPARTLSQSSVQENSRAQENHCPRTLWRYTPGMRFAVIDHRCATDAPSRPGSVGRHLSELGCSGACSEAPA